MDTIFEYSFKSLIIQLLLNNNIQLFSYQMNIILGYSFKDLIIKHYIDK